MERRKHKKEKEGREKREAYKKKGLTRYDFITLYPAAELKILILCLSGCREVLLPNLWLLRFYHTAIEATCSLIQRTIRACSIS